MSLYLLRLFIKAISLYSSLKDSICPMSYQSALLTRNLPCKSIANFFMTPLIMFIMRISIIRKLILISSERLIRIPSKIKLTKNYKMQQSLKKQIINFLSIRITQLKISIIIKSETKAFNLFMTKKASITIKKTLNKIDIRKLISKTLKNSSRKRLKKI